MTLQDSVIAFPVLAGLLSRTIISALYWICPRELSNTEANSWLNY